jgi:hypothetical protein
MVSSSQGAAFAAEFMLIAPRMQQKRHETTAATRVDFEASSRYRSGRMSLNARPWAKLCCAVAVCGLSLLIRPSEAHAQGAPDIGNKPYKYDRLFPFWGKKLAKRGLSFPLPFGVGVNYAYVKQSIDITGVNVALNDREYRDLSGLVKFDHVTSNVKVINGRLDLWLFPFLNVYGLGSWVVDSDTDVLLSEPIKLRSGASQSGYGGGFGGTVAFGFWGFFGVVDANLAWTKMEKLDAPVRTFLLTPRVGKRFKIGENVWLATWVGAMRQSITAKTEGAISLKDAIGAPEGSVESMIARAAVNREFGPTADPNPTIHYKLNKSLTDPWNMLIGAEVDLHKRVQMRMEYGFIGRTQLIMGICYRFGGFPALNPD